MRDLLVFMLVMAALPAGFVRPFVGMLLFSWLAYMRPQDLCWGFAKSFRFSFYAAIVMLSGWFANEMGRRPFMRWDLRTSLMVLLAVLVSVSFAMARVQTKYEVTYFIEFLKIIVIALFTTGQVTDRRRLRVLMILIACCLGFYGFKNGIGSILGGMAPIMRGPGGMLEDNNDFALALVMAVPLLFYLGRTERETHRYVWPATMITIGMTCATILLTHSRGAFLALAMTSMWMVWRSGQLFRASLWLGVLAAVALLFIPDHVWERVSTIAEGGEESSANARLTSWTIALHMIMDHPVLGVGLRNFQHYYGEYAYELFGLSKTFAYVAHNSYLQIWAEAGSIAFAVYLGLLSSVFFTCRKVFRIGGMRPDLAWLKDYARMFEATTVGFMVGATFLNRGHFDLIYHFFALVGCLLFIAQRELAKVPVEQRSVERGVSVRWRTVPLQPAFRTVGSAMMPRWGRDS